MLVPTLGSGFLGRIFAWGWLFLAVLISGATRGQVVQQPNRWGEDRPLRECSLARPAGPATGVYATNAWPGGIVPYEFDANVTPANRDAARAAMAEIEAVANILFIQRTGESDFLHILDSSRNSSWVGRQGGPQNVEIYNWNYRFIIVHELMHALAFWHEHQRSDRDQYVQINYGNIQSGQSQNFDIVTNSIPVGPYDFDSVMHYGECAFSTCTNCPSNPNECRTITILPPNEQWQTQIGQLTRLSSGDVLALAHVYGGQCSPCDWTRFLVLPDGVGIRSAGGSCWDSIRSRMVVFGGYDGVSGGLRNTIEFDGLQWTVAHPGGASAPPARWGVAMTFDELRRVAIIFGGYNFTYFGDTWTWNGSAWTRVSTAGPSARNYAAMVCDTRRGVIVLFGGNIGPTTYGDTWEWDGQVWTQRQPSGATPVPRTYPSMAYDPLRGRVVLFGGSDHDGSPTYGDTWEFDGNRWYHVATTGPAPRSFGAMVWDAQRRRIVLHGGRVYLTNQYFADTWEWDGATWRERQTSMAERRGSAMAAYDPIQRRVIIHGGANGSGYRRDTVALPSNCGVPCCNPDVNCDGSADGFDVEAMEQAVGGDMSNFCQPDPDFNHDGSVDGFDVESVEQVVGGAPCP